MKRRQGVATWWLPAAALVFGREAKRRPGLVQEEEERCGIGPVKKTREDWIGEEPEVGGDKRGVAAAARRMDGTSP